MIGQILLHWVQIPFLEPFRISNGSVSVKDSIIVEARAGGFTGFGEASPMSGSFYSPETPESTWQALADTLVPLVLGHSFDDPKQLTLPDGEPFAQAGLDGALWDLVCQRSGAPLWRLLGSQPRLIPSGVAIGIFDTVEELLDRVARFLAAGYRRVKIKIQPGWDIEPVRAVREKFGAVPLMVDANAAYTLRDLDLFRELDRFDLMMYEQPLEREARDERFRLGVCPSSSPTPRP